MKDYTQIKKGVDNYFQAQSELLPSQNFLKKFEEILSKSRRYLDYCKEINFVFENNIEVICLADFFFLDCSIVFNRMSIIELAKLLDNDLRTICIEKFFNKLRSVDAKKLGIYKSVNNFYEADLIELNDIRTKFVKFKEKRDKEIAHFDKSIISQKISVLLDMNSLAEIQSRSFILLEKYYDLLLLPKPAKLSDQSSYESIGIISGLDTISHVIKRALTELDFSENQKISKILNGLKTAKEIVKYGNS